MTEREQLEVKKEELTQELKHVVSLIFQMNENKERIRCRLDQIESALFEIEGDEEDE